MLISRKTDYALILIGALKPTFRSGDFMPLKLIARQYRLPYAYTEKLASSLKRAGVLEAQIGKSGGYRLARDPKKITLQSIVNVFQAKPMVRCMVSLHPRTQGAEQSSYDGHPRTERAEQSSYDGSPQKSCALSATCPTRASWNKADDAIRKALSKIYV